MKLSPEEQKEKRKEVNRQYQLKNKELLKGFVCEVLPD